jgi:hypothetical protein
VPGTSRVDGNCPTHHAPCERCTGDPEQGCPGLICLGGGEPHHPDDPAACEPSSDHPPTARRLAEFSPLSLWLVDATTGHRRDDLLELRDGKGRACGTGLEWEPIARAVLSHLESPPN